MPLPISLVQDRDPMGSRLCEYLVESPDPELVVAMANVTPAVSFGRSFLEDPAPGTFGSPPDPSGGPRPSLWRQLARDAFCRAVVASGEFACWPFLHDREEYLAICEGFHEAWDIAIAPPPLSPEDYDAFFGDCGEVPSRVFHVPPASSLLGAARIVLTDAGSCIWHLSLAPKLKEVHAAVQNSARPLLKRIRGVLRTALPFFCLFGLLTLGAIGDPEIHLLTFTRGAILALLGYWLFQRSIRESVSRLFVGRDLWFSAPMALREPLVLRDRFGPRLRSIREGVVY